jgi:hypothetical protein
MGRILLIILCLSAGHAIASQETVAPPVNEVVISVADQRLVLLHEGSLVGKFRVSTSKFGVGDSFYSYKTPAGKLRVCEKIGDALDPGAVIKHRTVTGEVLRVNTPGRDPIVTRILWLEGLESQNHNAKARGIYIHGTPEERTIGEPRSWGCIRMRSSDVMEVFDQVPVGTQVSIIPGHLPHLEKYRPPEPVLVADTPPPAPVSAGSQEHMPAAIPAPVAAVSKKISVSTTAVSAAPSASATDSSIAVNQRVSHAFKGSILMVGLPNAPTFDPAQHVAAQTAAAVGATGEKNTGKP